MKKKSCLFFKRSLSLGLIILLALINTPLWIHCNENTEPIPLESISLHLSEHPLYFDPPPIKKGSVIYVPIRSLIAHLGGTVSYSRVQDHYNIKLANNEIKIALNSRIAYKNNNKRRLSHKTLRYQTRLYVPLHSFSSLLNYAIENARNRFEQELVCEALKFKTDVLWVMQDALYHSYVNGHLPPDAFVPEDFDDRYTEDN